MVPKLGNTVMPTTETNCFVPGSLLILTAAMLLVVTAGCQKQPSAGTDATAQFKKKLAMPPEFDHVPVSVRDLKDVEKGRFYAAVEKGIQAGFPNAE